MNLSKKDALSILDCVNSSTLEDIKIAYRRACRMYHPDRNAAGLEMMKLVNAAYEVLRDYEPTSEADEMDINLGDELNDALNAIQGLGLTIEICGSWIWVSGDTRPHKEALKAAGYRWANVKKMWHYSPKDSKTKSRGKYSMDEVRAMHGSQSVKSKQFNRIAA